jgi:hypothetical protein
MSKTIQANFELIQEIYEKRENISEYLKTNSYDSNRNNLVELPKNYSNHLNLAVPNSNGNYLFYFIIFFYLYKKKFPFKKRVILDFIEWFLREVHVLERFVSIIILIFHVLY